MRTEIRHTATTTGVSGADPLRMPGDYPGQPDRWMRPEDVPLDYQHGSDLLDQRGWRLVRLSITGPWVTQDNQIDPRALGRPVVTGRSRAGLAACADHRQPARPRHRPDHRLTRPARPGRHPPGRTTHPH